VGRNHSPSSSSSSSLLLLSSPPDVAEAPACPAGDVDDSDHGPVPVPAPPLGLDICCRAPKVGDVGQSLKSIDSLDMDIGSIGRVDAKKTRAWEATDARQQVVDGRGMADSSAWMRTPPQATPRHAVTRHRQQQASATGQRDCGNTHLALRRG
jgi:hypothetical protein